MSAMPIPVLLYYCVSGFVLVWSIVLGLYVWSGTEYLDRNGDYVVFHAAFVNVWVTICVAVIAGFGSYQRQKVGIRLAICLQVLCVVWLALVLVAITRSPPQISSQVVNRKWDRKSPTKQALFQKANGCMWEAAMGAPNASSCRNVYADSIALRVQHFGVFTIVQVALQALHVVCGFLALRFIRNWELIVPST